MIKKANLFLYKAELVRLKEIAWLEQFNAQNDEVLQQEMVKRATLAESRLACPKWRTSTRLI